MEAVGEARDAFDVLSKELTERNGEDEAAKLQRSMGLKMEQLNQELEIVLHADH
jgi:hypothetical protein